MHDDFEPGIEPLEELDPVTPAIFRRVMLAADGDSTWADALALSAAIAAGAEAVTVPDAADLIVIGSDPEGVAGQVSLSLAGQDLIQAARSPVAAAPRGLAERDGYEMRQIDVGIDGSREATAALALATHLARAHDARLRLVAVAEPGPDHGGTPAPADPRELERLGRHLESAGEGLPGIWVEADLREGLADEILTELSRGADLMVLGSRAAYGDGGRVSLGRAATGILRSAACPVLIAPAP